MSKKRLGQKDDSSNLKIRRSKSDDVGLTSMPKPLNISKLDKSLTFPDIHDFMKKNAADYAPELLWEFFSEAHSSKEE